MWHLAACDMMVSDCDGNTDDDLVKKKVIDSKYPITAMKACEALEAAANTLVTACTSPGGQRKTCPGRHASDMTTTSHPNHHVKPKALNRSTWSMERSSTAWRSRMQVGK